MPDHHSIRSSSPLQEAVLLVAGLLFVNYVLIATMFDFLLFLIGHIVLYVGMVGWLTRRFHQLSDSPPWIFPLSAILVPVGMGSMAVVVYANQLTGPLLIVLLGGSLWVWTARRANRNHRYVAFAVTVVGLAVVFGAFSPLNIGGRAEPPGLPVSIEFILLSDEFVFGFETPVLLFTKNDFHVEMLLLPALIGLSVYSLGRQYTASGNLRSE